MMAAVSMEVQPPSGDSFEESFERLTILAHRVAARVLGPAGDAENIAAETMARAQVSWSRMSDHPEAWVVTVSSRLAVREARRGGRSLPWRLFRKDVADEVLAEDRIALAAALRKLPSRQRQAVTLRYLADLSDEDSASLLGCSVSSLRTHTRRGLEKLRADLQDPPAWANAVSEGEEIR